MFNVEKDRKGDKWQNTQKAAKGHCSFQYKQWIIGFYNETRGLISNMQKWFMHKVNLYWKAGQENVSMQMLIPLMIQKDIVYITKLWRENNSYTAHSY